MKTKLLTGVAAFLVALFVGASSDAWAQSG